MTIKKITDKFVDLRTCSGALMQSRWDRETKTQHLTYRVSGNPIADIYDYKDSKNYRLRLWPYLRYDGRTAHNNRLYQVLYSIQIPVNQARDWDKLRYSTYIRYSIRVYDRKLSTEYELKNPMEFIFRDGMLTLDYQHLEKFAYPNAPVAPTIELESNSSLQTIDNKLNAILAGV